jgi:hypothetical protein
MNFAEYQAADRRLVLLKALEAASQYKANSFLLRSFCDTMGHVVSADTIATDLAWLAEQSLVTVDRQQTITVATLTQRGLDVASGRAKVPGVQAPQPGG